MRQRHRIPTYIVLEVVLVLVVLIDVLKVVIVIIKVLKLKRFAGEVVNRTGNDLHVSRQGMNMDHATGRRTFSLISSPSW